MSLASIGYLKAVVMLLEQGGGSRGSHLVLSEDGIEIHSDVIDNATGQPLKFKPENEELRNSIIQVLYNSQQPDLFECKIVLVRKAPSERKAFEPVWKKFREGNIYDIGNSKFK